MNTATKAPKSERIKIPKINPDLIPPLEGKLLGRTFYAAMVRFYADPKNQRRFEEWQQKRSRREGLSDCEKD